MVLDTSDQGPSHLEVEACANKREEWQEDVGGRHLLHARSKSMYVRVR
jgi:hypothetical protein